MHGILAVGSAFVRPKASPGRSTADFGVWLKGYVPAPFIQNRGSSLGPGDSLLGEAIKGTAMEETTQSPFARVVCPSKEKLAIEEEEETGSPRPFNIAARG